ncbi:uncharacterized protein EKO05_0010668 [Ascochyta rabiei]|uniref:Metal ion binding n=1 Tax=Didymella rabiei TaxID=5454 RepID=A0A163ATE1_DIDRA|nr:uncharacterized protein EKO05_0010668 [Ascochyta rabiei]KZM21375.1 metal ion binding [Ascochyta rabiei]UPX20437.1 hypothetical protein EKO05_0010668 [Ascochyta rabiei]
MRQTVTAMMERRGRYSSPSHGEMQRSLLRLESDRAIAVETRTRQATLGDLLDPRYTTDLPSSTFNNITDPDNADQNADPGAPLEAHYLPSTATESDAYQKVSHSAYLNEDTQTENGITSPIRLGQSEIAVPNTFRDSGYGSMNEEISYSPVDKKPDKISEVSNVGLENSASDHRRRQVGARQHRYDAERHERTTCDHHSPEKQIGAVDEEYAWVAVERQLLETSPENTEDADESKTGALTEEIDFLKKADKRKSSLERSPPPEHAGYIPEDYYADWEQVPSPAAAGHYILRRPSVPNYDPYSTSDLEEPLDAPPKIPTTIHLKAVAQLIPRDCTKMIIDFLKQNSSRIDVFRTRREMYSGNTSGGTRSIVTNFSPAWDSRVELGFLTDAMLWLDALLLPFRDEILAEDNEYLKPRLEHAVRIWHAIKDPSSKDPDLLNEEEEIQIEMISNCIAEIQSSNQRRTELLESTNIDVGIIENLLMSAETVRHRRDLDRENDQRDDLTDSLRRIYRTVVCTIPVGLSEDDAVVQPKQSFKIQYKGGPFNPYVLPDPPEIFSHVSTDTRVTTQGYTGVPLSEQRASLSDEYFHGMHEEMFQVIAAQSQDSAGTAKLAKNANCMDRDWRRVYDPLFGEGMRRYEGAASRRIEEEEHEAKRQDRKRDATEEVKKSSTGEEITTGTTFFQSSPAFSDYTCFTDTSVEITLPFQDDSKPASSKMKFCLDINKPGGCANRDACPHDHSNKGVFCNKNPCAFANAGTCAFLHTGTRTARPSQSSPEVCDPNLIDLRPILSQVLATPRRYKACTFVNKSRGCKTENEGKVCGFNHTLRGVSCPDLGRDRSCPRGDRYCPLMHISSNNENTGSTAADPSWAVSIPSRVHDPVFQRNSKALPSPVTYLTQSNDQGLGIALGEQQQPFQTSHTTLPSYPLIQPQQQLSNNPILKPSVPTGPRNQPQSLALTTSRTVSQARRPSSDVISNQLERGLRIRGATGRGTSPHFSAQYRTEANVIATSRQPQQYGFQDLSGENQSSNYYDASGTHKRKHGEQQNRNQGAVTRDRLNSSFGPGNLIRNQDYKEAIYDDGYGYTDRHELDEEKADLAEGSRSSKKRHKNDQYNIGYPGMGRRS